MREKISAVRTTWIKIIVGMILTTVLSILLLCYNTVPVKAATADAAISWVQSQVGKAIDYDGVSGVQCVDLIKAYYNYLGVSPVAGNGADYATNSLPSGWKRIQGAVPQKGDILVYSGNSSNPYGHVAIFESTYITYHQNYNGKYVRKITNTAYNNFANPYWGVVRPLFNGSDPQIQDVGTDFYAYIINTYAWLHATNEDSGNVCVRKETGAANQIWLFERLSDGSYKITSRKDGRCMEVHNFESANGTNVEMNNYNGNTAQRWFIYGDSGQYTFKAACGDNVLDVAGGAEGAQDGTNLQMWEDNGTAAQKFQIWKLQAPELGKPSVKFEAYGDNSGNNVRLTWNACENATGYDVRIYDKAGNILYTFWNVQDTSYIFHIPSGEYQVDVAALNNRFNTWRFGDRITFKCAENLGSGFYAYITNTEAGLYVTNEKKDNICVRKESGESDQIWYFELLSDGSYKILSCKDECCLEAKSAESGTALSVNDYGGNSGQRWYIYGSEGKYTLKIGGGDNVLDVKGGVQNVSEGTPLQIWENNETAAQKFSILKVDSIVGNIRHCLIELSQTEYTYDGSAKTPSVIVSDGTKVLEEKKDYRLEYADNIESGEATAIIIGIGAYTGSVVKPFIIKEAEKITNPFTDIVKTDYYYNSVLWAYNNNITSGVTENKFAPDAQCTRAQVVIFLWRAKGQPKASLQELPFEDVEKGTYYYDAVAWAYENNIVSGVDGTHFGPDDPVSRGQFVTFLYRTEGKPGYTSENPFTDVAQWAYYYDPVLWAYEKGIASGLSEDTFGPDEFCTRGQVVTFLYRAYN